MEYRQNAHFNPSQIILFPQFSTVFTRAKISPRIRSGRSFPAPFEKRGLAFGKQIPGESGPRQSFFSSARS